MFTSNRKAVILALALVVSHLVPGVARAENQTVNNAEAVEKKELALENAPAHISTHPRMKAAIRINARPETVWRAIHEERTHDPDIAYSKVLTAPTPHECTLEQKFQLLPVFGTSVCVMNDVEVPLKRIDYWLLRSDRFKAMEGSWVITPAADGRSCDLELSSFVDLGLPVPRRMLDGMTQMKLQRRVANVKKAAEKEEKGLARSSTSL